MSNVTIPSVDLQQVLARAQLPALPQSALRLLKLSQDPEKGPSEFAVPLESDLGLASQVLRFVNSSHFGFSREISTIKLAVTLVGIKTIKDFALWNAVISLVPSPKCGPLDSKRLWYDSLRRALFARALSKHLGMADAEKPFVAALLQDMAIPVLAKEFPDIYTQLLMAREKDQCQLSSLEQATFGWTHGQVAGMMAQHWNLPEAFVPMLESHASASECLERTPSELGRVAVAMSALLPSTADRTWPEGRQLETYYTRLCGSDSLSLEELLGQIDHEFTWFTSALDLTHSHQSLVESYRELAVVAD